ncbi:Hsp20/alpha crystallin family protein [Thermofilum sp.]|uniref:Hsp20/alpha crystallin family protein n=1 Tax=Thermofilum sp. TaxID=1961369 RepID=UPI00316D6649
MEEWIRNEIEQFFKEIRKMREEMAKLEQEFFKPTPIEEKLQVPLYEVKRHSDKLVVCADLAGVKRKEDINVTVEGGTLKIEAILHRPISFEGFTLLREPITKYRLEVPIPDNADTDNIKASFKKGILEVEIPLKIRRVKVNVE